MTPEVKQALESLETAKNIFQTAVRSAQKQCEHNHLVECDYERDFEFPRPPLRLCLDCGMTEEGWGCGYKVLKIKEKFGVTLINRNKLLPQRMGLFIREKEKNILIRNEKNLGQLIDDAIY